MTPFERERAKLAAQAKLAAMRERAARLRRRVLAIAATGFVLLWAAVFAQMITGHDPALGPVAATVRPATQEPDEEGWSEATRFEAEQLEAQEAEAREAIEAEAAEAEELEAATTGQS
jgi:hypothetical protein